jgi:hypothetical protein
MKMLASAIFTLCVFWTTSVFAQSQPVVVELFTSQGCSSCPPADALMQELAKREDVIPLSLHVDYWDYIGWKDEFARPENTKRQRGYARSAGRKMVYTPEMIINGQDGIVGARSMELADLIAHHKALVPIVQLQIHRNGQALNVLAHPVTEGLNGPLVVHLVRFSPLKSSDITRGENAGRSLEYVNVVDGWSVLGEWDGVGPMEMTVDLEGKRPAVVLVQHKGPGPIIAAALAE